MTTTQTPVDARDETTELLAWFDESGGFNQGTKAPHKWVLRAEQELRRNLEASARALAAIPEPTAPAQDAQGVLTNDALIHALAECRDAFPIPANGGPAEDEWMTAIGFPLAVPAYVRAALRASSPADTRNAPLYDPADVAFPPLTDEQIRNILD